jgi:hypothetical protein
MLAAASYSEANHGSVMADGSVCATASPPPEPEEGGDSSETVKADNASFRYKKF